MKEVVDMEPIRVLHIVDSLSISSGVMSVVMNWYKNIDRSKIQFDFVVNFENENNYEELIKSLGGRIFKIATPTPYNLIKYNKEIDNFFKFNNEYRIIHSHTPTLTGFYFRSARKYGIENRIIHSHSTMYSDSKIKSIRNYLLCLPIKKYATRRFACSHQAGKFLYGQKKDFEVINNSVDCENFAFNEEIRKRVRKKLELEDKLVIGHIGRLEKEKNHEFLLDIFYEIQKKEKDTELLLIGDGSLKSILIDKCINLGISDKVKFLGIRNNINELVQAIDILLFPSLFEGFPVVCIEAQAAGVKCFVSSNVSDCIKVTDLIRFISLDKSDKEWANIIVENKKYRRNNMAMKVKQSGFDIKDITQYLEKQYLSFK